MQTAPQSAPEKKSNRGAKKAPPSPRPTDPTSDDRVNQARVTLTTGIPAPTLNSWVRAGKFPKPVKYGTHRNAPIRWRWCDVMAWLAEQDRRSEAAAEENAQEANA